MVTVVTASAIKGLNTAEGATEKSISVSVKYSDSGPSVMQWLTAGLVDRLLYQVSLLLNCSGIFPPLLSTVCFTKSLKTNKYISMQKLQARDKFYIRCNLVCICSSFLAQVFVTSHVFGCIQISSPCGEQKAQYRLGQKIASGAIGYHHFYFVFICQYLFTKISLFSI